jgi:electron-transferring-flavoprotein dehydrogenase
LPNWKELGAPLIQEATKDRMRWLTPTRSIAMPHPPQMSNKGNYIVSLSKVVRWLGEQAEALGIEIYPGFAGASIIYTDDRKGIKGVVTNDIGLDRHKKPKDTFEPGMEFHARATLIAEGARGSLGESLIKHFDLRKGREPQTYGIGIKEVWRVKDQQHRPGEVMHTLGWPLDNRTYGGSFMYHGEDNTVSLGLVIGLDYPNPYISPFREFQVSGSSC